jgi:hypothetical protein
MILKYITFFAIIFIKISSIPVSTQQVFLVHKIEQYIHNIENKIDNLEMHNYSLNMTRQIHNLI